MKVSQNTVTVLERRLSEQETEINLLREQVRHLKRQLFGKKSEKLSKEAVEAAMKQMSLFNEAELIADEPSKEEEEAEDTITVPAHTRKKKGRKPLPKDLPREIVYHDLPESEQYCPCGAKMVRIGQESSEQLHYVPAQLKIIEHVQYKYACKVCEDTVKLAPPPVKPIQKSIASSSLLAHTLVGKFCDHLPLYRQSRMWERQNIDIGRRTLANWVLACGELLSPIVAHMSDDIAASGYVCSDETPMRVLDEEKQCYLWVHRTGDRHRPIIVYDYHPSRSASCVLSFLPDYSGYHQSDGYAGYRALHDREGVTALGCWDHARRKFVDIVKMSRKQGVAAHVVKEIKKLYALEAKIKAQKTPLSHEEIRKIRQEKALPVLKGIKSYIDEQSLFVVKDSALDKAIGYMRNQWESLLVYTTDGRLYMSNITCEQAVRGVAVGRKNWLFCNTKRGANATATIYSLIQTCKAHQVEPWGYLLYVLEHIKRYRHDNEGLKALLPYEIDKEKLTEFVGEYRKSITSPYRKAA